MKHLTDKQTAVLQFVREYIGRNGFSPATSEIAFRFNIRPNAALDHLKALERKGSLTKAPGIPRSIVLTENHCQPD